MVIKHVDGFDNVHGWYGVGNKDVDMTIFLRFYTKKELCV